MQKITVQWLGHSCFKLTFGDYTAVIGPYEDGSVPGLKPLQVSGIDVFASHNHHDHNAKSVVKQIKMFAPRPQIELVPTFHDEVNGAKRGENTVHVFEHESHRIAHFGDLGHLLTPEQIEKIGRIDLALIPIGGFYTIDAVKAKQVAEQIKAKVVIPMHYRTKDFGLEAIGTLEAFTDICDNVKIYDTDTFVLTPQTQAQVAVLKYMK